MKTLTQYNAWVERMCLRENVSRAPRAVRSRLIGQKEPTRFGRQKVQPIDYNAIAERSQRVQDAPGSDAAPAAVKGFGDFNADPYLVYGSRGTSVTPPSTPQQRVQNGRHVQARQEASSLNQTYTDWNNSEVAQAFKRSLPEGQKRGDRAQTAKDRQDSNRATALNKMRNEQGVVNSRLLKHKRKADSAVEDNREMQKAKEVGRYGATSRAQTKLQTQDKVTKPDHRPQAKMPPHKPGAKSFKEVHMKPSNKMSAPYKKK